MIGKTYMHLFELALMIYMYMYKCILQYMYILQGLNLTILMNLALGVL